MTAVAKFTEVFVIAFCTLLMPKNGKEIMVTTAGDSGPGETMKVVKTEEGFDCYSYHDLSRRIVRFTRSKTNPDILTFQLDDQSEEVNLGPARKGLAAIGDKPEQSIKLEPGKVTVSARGNTVFLTFEGIRKTYVLHGTGEPGPEPASQPVEVTATVKTYKAAREMFEKFWAALAKGDAQEMKKHYADQVTLKAGSELLAGVWGFNPTGDRGKDLVVTREALAGGYEKLIAKVGQEKWTGLFSAVKHDSVLVFPAEPKDRTFGPPAAPGDLVMKVLLGGNEFLLFLVREVKPGNWHVIAERTDY